MNKICLLVLLAFLSLFVGCSRQIWIDGNWIGGHQPDDFASRVERIRIFTYAEQSYKEHPNDRGGRYYPEVELEVTRQLIAKGYEVEIIRSLGTRFVQDSPNQWVKVKNSDVTPQDNIAYLEVGASLSKYSQTYQRTSRERVVDVFTNDGQNIGYLEAEVTRTGTYTVGDVDSWVNLYTNWSPSRNIWWASSRTIKKEAMPVRENVKRLLADIPSRR